MDASQVECIVEKVNARLDAVFLVPRSDIEVERIGYKLTYTDELFIHLGFSNIAEQPSPSLTVNVGNIATETLDSNGHLLVSVGSSEGDAGGPIFSFLEGHLLGMLVGCSSNSQQGDFVPICILLN